MVVRCTTRRVTWLLSGPHVAGGDRRLGTWLLGDGGAQGSRHKQRARAGFVPPNTQSLPRGLGGASWDDKSPNIRSSPKSRASLRLNTHASPGPTVSLSPRALASVDSLALPSGHCYSHCYSTPLCACFAPAHDPTDDTALAPPTQRPQQAMAPSGQPLPTRFPCWCKAIYSWGGEVRLPQKAPHAQN